MSALDAGNTIEGVQWGQSALANCRWFGVALRDMLLSMGIPDPYVDSSGSVRCDLEPNERSIHQDSADWSRSLHVHFISSQVLPSSESKGDEDSLSQGDVDQQKNRFGSSISLATALHPNTQVLLSYSVNTSDEALDTEHGYPLRMVIPGHLAARWTKWLNHIRISRSQNASEPMMQDYKILQPPPGCSQQERSDWLKSMSGGSSARRKELLHQPPMVRLGVGSSISSPAPSQIVQVCAATQSTPYPYLEVSGYAVGSEGSPVSKIELAIVADDSDSNEAAIRQKALDMDQWLCLTADNSQQQTPSSLQGRLVDEGNPPHVPTWSWTLWQINLPTNAVMTSSAFNIVVRARKSHRRQHQTSDTLIDEFSLRTKCRHTFRNLSGNAVSVEPAGFQRAKLAGCAEFKSGANSTRIVTRGTAHTSAMGRERRRAHSSTGPLQFHNSIVSKVIALIPCIENWGLR